MPEEIERLTVAIETNLDALLKDTDKAINDITKRLERLERQGDDTFDDMTDGAKKFDRELDKTGKSVKGLGNQLSKLQGIAAGIFGAEVLRRGFELMISTTDAAIEAQAEQFNLAASVAAANREFGDSVGNLESWRMTIEGLDDQLAVFSDNEVANATARLVDMTKRLGLTEEEMRVVLSRTADLSAGKVDLAGGVERVTAALRGEAESAEFLGLSLNETVIMNYAEAQGLVFKNLTDNEKAQLRYQVLLEQTNQIQGRAAQFANTLAGAEAQLNAEQERAIAQLGAQLLPLRQGYTEALSLLAGTTQESGSIISDVLAFITASYVTFGATTTAVINNKIDEFLGYAQGLQAGFDAILAGDNPFDAAAPFFEQSAESSSKATDAVLSVADTFQDAFNQIRGEYNKLADGTDDLDIVAGLPPIEDIPPLILPEIEAENIDFQTELLQNLGLSLIDEQNKVNQQLEENQQNHIDKMADIEQDGINERLAINAKYDQEVLEKSAQIRQDAQQELADIERDSEREIADIREDGQIDEARELEDHLTNLRRLRQNYLDSLDQIVANRDARALVDARKNYQRQQQEENENFERSRSRENEDLTRQIDEIRETEQERSQEILQEREDSLRELMEVTERARQRELENLEAELAEKKQKEIMAFNERQAELQGWLQRSLEDIAIGLAQQDEVTEKGAQQILGTLSEYFGQGGLIDELMQDYKDRLAEIASFSPQVEGPGLPPSLPEFGGAFAQGGSMMASKPTLALFGEAGPELAQFTPLSKMQNGQQDLNVNITMSGSAPPGIRSADRDQIASVLINALRESGAMG